MWERHIFTNGVMKINQWFYVEIQESRDQWHSLIYIHLPKNLMKINKFLDNRIIIQIQIGLSFWWFWSLWSSVTLDHQCEQKADVVVCEQEVETRAAEFIRKQCCIMGVVYFQRWCHRLCSFASAALVSLWSVFMLLYSNVHRWSRSFEWMSWR